MPLRDLLVSEQKVTEDVLEKTLKDFVLLGDKRRIVFTPAGEQLPAEARVLLVLVAQHAWRFVVQGEEQDTSLPVAEIQQQTGLTGNTARPTLKSLKDRGIIESPERGVYRLPPYSLGFVVREMDKFRHSPPKPSKTKAARSRRRRGQVCSQLQEFRVYQ